jgi:hypothetical protein
MIRMIRCSLSYCILALLSPRPMTVTVGHDMNCMRVQVSLMAISVAANFVFSPPVCGAGDSEYADVTGRIIQRIGTLTNLFPAVDWPQAVPKAKVLPDGSGNLAVEYAVEWVRDHPGELPSKLNGVRPVYTLGGYWFRLTFLRGPWIGAAVFPGIDFGDLHLWFESDYKDDAAVIRAIAQIIEEERRAFESGAKPD